MPSVYVGSRWLVLWLMLMTCLCLVQSIFCGSSHGIGICLSLSLSLFSLCPFLQPLLPVLVLIWQSLHFYWFFPSIALQFFPAWSMDFFTVFIVVCKLFCPSFQGLWSVFEGVLNPFLPSTHLCSLPASSHSLLLSFLFTMNVVCPFSWIKQRRRKAQDFTCIVDLVL